MILVKPQRCCVKPFFVRLACASNSSEMADEFQRGQRVVGPRNRQTLDQIAGRRVGHDVEEEVEAWVAGGEKRG